MKLYLGFFLTWVHVLVVAVWLGLDMAVFTLSFGALDRKQPMAVRIDRAQMAERFDFWVLKAFLLTTPIGLVLAHLRGYDPFATDWLSLKLALLGLIFLIAVVLIAGAAGTTVILRQIAQETTDGQTARAEALEAQLRKRVIGLAYPVWVLYSLIAAIIFIALTKWIF